MDKQRCRCCSTTKSDHYFDLFEKYKTSRTYAENIHNIAEVDVERNDGLPQYACGDCFSELQNVIEFALIIRQTDGRLRMELQQQHQTFVRGKSMLEVESDQVVEEDDQEDIQVCILEEEVVDGEETLQQQAEMTIVEEYVKDENAEDLQMVEEVLEFDEEVPNDSIEHILPKENDLLQELAQVAATQENVHVEQTQDDPNSQQEDYYPEDECDDEYLIEYNPAEESHCNFKPPKWKCVECKIILRGDVSYEGHMNIHKKIRPYKCPQCRCLFRCRNSLKKHKEIRHIDSFSAHNTKIEGISIVQIKCIDCNVECQTEIDLLKHELMAHNKHSHTTSCPFCPGVSVDNLLNHLQSAHTDQPSIPDDEATETLLEPLPSSTITFLNCNMCSKTYNSLSALNRHCKMYHNVATGAEHGQVVTSSKPITSWHCDTCSKTYCSLSALNDHRKLCHEADDADAIVMDEYVCYVNMMDSIVHCEICKKKLQRKNLNKHMAMHERKDKEAEEQPTKLLCAYCPQTFVSDIHLTNHVSSTHYTTSTAESCVVHLQYECTKHDEAFEDSQLLREHVQKQHYFKELQPKYVCKICGNLFGGHAQLSAHKRLHKERPFKCVQCEKAYPRKVELDIHIRSHTGELPYACHLCDKRFAIKVRLTYHLQKHEGVKHSCSYCSAVYDNRNKLKAHLFKHTGMPYKCELCPGLGFERRLRFSNHMQRVHQRILSDDELAEIFAKNTGKTVRFTSTIGKK